MTDAELIRSRGGIRPVARKLGHRNHTTVQGWFERDRIPLDELRTAVEALPAAEQVERAA